MKKSQKKIKKVAIMISKYRDKQRNKQVGDSAFPCILFVFHNLDAQRADIRQQTRPLVYASCE